MRLLVGLVVLTACATPARPVTPAAPIAPCPACPGPAQSAQPPQLAPLDEASVKAKTHGWLEAFDQADVAAFTEPLGKTFVLFEFARFLERDLLVKSLQNRKDRGVPTRTRVWKDERVFLSDTTALYIGRSALTGADMPDSEGHDTVVWVSEGGRWVIAHWGWQKSGLEADRDRWNHAYEQSRGFNKKPNQLLVDTIKGKKPGTALDVAMGQGRNAVFLAAQGWKTTGVDISDEGMRQAKAEADKQKVKLETVNADLDKYDFGKAKWDLVTLIYAGDDAKLVERIKPSIKKGGLFVCEYFHEDSDVAKTGAGGWGTGELAALFKDGFKVVRDDVVEDNADWAGMRKTKLVRFVAQKL